MSAFASVISVTVTSLPHSTTELVEFFDSIWTVSNTDRVDLLLDKADQLVFILYMLCFLLMSLFGTAFVLFGSVRAMFGRPRRRTQDLSEASFELLPRDGENNFAEYLPDLTAFYQRMTSGLPEVEQK